MFIRQERLNLKMIVNFYLSHTNRHYLLTYVLCITLLQNIQGKGNFLLKYCISEHNVKLQCNDMAMLYIWSILPVIRLYKVINGTSFQMY